MKLLEMYEGLNLEETVTVSLSNGNAVTMMIGDALLFIEQEVEIEKYIETRFNLLREEEGKRLKDGINSFLKELFFNVDMAKKFVIWQRKCVEWSSSRD